MKKILVVLLLSFFATSSMGQSVKLTGPEIVELLHGNTAFGRWQGEKYRQWFGPDGVTLYAQAQSRTARGEWRVDHEAQEYQSIWPGDGEWEGWFVMEYGGTYYWVSRSTPPTPFQISPGQDLTSE